MVRKIIKISGVEYILYLVAPFGKIGKKKKILDYSYNKLIRHLDSIYIMRKLLDIDKL
jgi:hypothetical protein